MSSVIEARERSQDRLDGAGLMTLPKPNTHKLQRKNLNFSNHPKDQHQTSTLRLSLKQNDLRKSCHLRLPFIHYILRRSRRSNYPRSFVLLLDIDRPRFE